MYFSTPLRSVLHVLFEKPESCQQTQTYALSRSTCFETGSSLGVRQEMKELVYLDGCSVVLILFAFPFVPAHLFTEGYKSFRRTVSSCVRCLKSMFSHVLSWLCCLDAQQTHRWVTPSCYETRATSAAGIQDAAAGSASFPGC